MKVLVLSPYPERLYHVLAEDEVWSTDQERFPENISYSNRYDFIISYGYRYIISESAIRRFKNHIINLHIGYLPWNRGADPNFWSWFDGSYKGVTIHHVDAGLDTGPIIARQLITPPNTMTLREVYDLLHQELVNLFAFHWKRIKEDAGTLHMSKDKDIWFAQLSAGWDSPCSEVEELGRKFREKPKITFTSTA